MGQKVFELYSQEKVNPFGSCGFLFIQMPILLVVYNLILKIQNPVNNYYIYSFFNDFSFSAINFNFY
ncbi:MAG: YidC/Oxa1 family membrane protein insertase [Candidatus Peribacteria bacterium]|nr:YidC/Oxa1 family membrane protein insertase [Candidatus Peribacteria bacterium]